MAASPSVADNFRTVLGRVEAAARAAKRATPVTLVAVSKFKPASMVREVYDAGHRVFGENYVQECVEKAAELPADVQWHFIGALQSNKAKALLAVPNLAMVESVHSEKLARRLQADCVGLGRTLDVLVQVNTSGEESKSGCEPADVVALVSFIRDSCPALRFRGLMTIGDPASITSPEAPDFVRLSECLTRVMEATGLARDALVLSMGMSGDFEQAIAFGSDNVRVGSSIFGAR